MLLSLENLRPAIAHDLVPEAVPLALVTLPHIIRDDVSTHARQQPRPITRSGPKFNQGTEREQGVQSGGVGNCPCEITADARPPVEALLDGRHAALGRQGRVRS